MSTGLQSDAIKEVERLAQAAKRVVIHSPAKEPADVYIVEKPDGEVERMVAEPLRKYQIGTPEEFVRFVAEHDGPDSSRSGQGVVFFDADNLTYYFDEETRRESARCILTETEQWAWLVNSSGGLLSQADLVRLLRITFRGCLPADSSLLSIVRNMKWASGAETDRNIQYGKESLGRAIEAKVTGAGTIPEELTLSVPIWNELRFPVLIACALELFPHEQKFRLTPFPAELQRGSEEGLARLAGMLSDTGCAAYHGQG